MTDHIKPGSKEQAAHLRDLKTFDLYHSQAGRLRRYCAGRARTFGARIGVALIGVGILGVLVSPVFGLMIAVITLILETAEQMILRRQLAQDAFDRPATGHVILAATAMQAVGIAIPIYLAGIQSNDLRFVAWAFAIGATINAMLSAGYHPASYYVRQGFVAAAVVAVVITGYVSGTVPLHTIATEATGMAVMVLMLAKLFLHISRRENRIVATERQMIEQAQEARKLAMVAEHAIDGVMLLDRDRRITWVNPHFSTMTGYSAQEALGKTPTELLNHPDTDPSAIEEIEAVARDHRPAHTLILNRRKDGSDIWVNVHQTPLLDENGTLETIISVERDATKRVAAERELSEALAKAQAADAAKTDFLSRMSHELRTPVNGIVGGAELLRETDMDDQQQEIAGMIRLSAQRMMRLVDDVLSYSELTSGQVHPRPETVDIGALLTSIASDLAPECADKGLTVTVSALAAPIAVSTDPILLRRLIDRLTSNAVKFTKRGGVTLSASHDGTALTIAVTDTGVGIDTGDHELIFDRFAQVDAARTRLHDGAGIGLTLARRLARLLGGELSVESERDVGSTFRFRLPTPLLAPVAASGGSRPLDILIAEDNRTNRLLLQKMLRDAPHHLRFAEDGQEAVETYAKAPPDLVLMDVSMPRKDGLEATRDIRQLEAERHLPHCPIVAVTANASDADRQVCFEAGMDGFISKPVRKAVLFDTIGSACAMRGSGASADVRATAQA